MAAPLDYREGFATAKTNAFRVARKKVDSIPAEAQSVLLTPSSEGL
jgi:hypothetical protein